VLFRSSVLTTKLTSDSLWEAFGTIMQHAIDTYAVVKYESTNNSAECWPNRWHPAGVNVLLQENASCGANTAKTGMTPKH